MKLEELKRLSAEATSAPWRVSVGLEGPRGPYRIYGPTLYTRDQANADINLTQAMRNNFDKLIAVAEAARSFVSTYGHRGICSYVSDCECKCDCGYDALQKALGGLNGDWIPQERDLELNRQRIEERKKK